MIHLSFAFHGYVWYGHADEAPPSSSSDSDSPLFFRYCVLAICCLHSITMCPCRQPTWKDGSSEVDGDRAESKCDRLLRSIEEVKLDTCKMRRRSTGQFGWPFRWSLHFALFSSSFFCPISVPSSQCHYPNTPQHAFMDLLQGKDFCQEKTSWQSGR